MAQTPVPEKVTKWLLYGATALVVTAGINIFGPSVNGALALVQQATSSLFSTALLGVGTAVVVGGAFAIAPAVDLGFKSLSRHLTWSMIQFDPVTPLYTLLKEVQKNLNQFEEQRSSLAAVMQSIASRAEKANSAAKENQDKFNAGMSQGKAREELSQFSIRAGSSRKTVENLNAIHQKLNVMMSLFERLSKGFKFQRDNLEAEIESQKATWEAKVAADEALSAGKKLLGGTKAREFYDLASRHIEDSYAETLGRFGVLKDLSTELLSSVDIQTGVYDQEAFARWEEAAKPLLIQDQRGTPLAYEINTTETANLFSRSEG
jgi:hypothetical protein